MKDITLKKIWVLILNIYCLKYVWNSKYEVIYQSCGIVLMRNRDFSKRKNIFCSFLLIKLFTVVIIAVVRSGRYKRFRMCSGLEFYSKTKDSHRWKHISPPAEFGANTVFVFCVVEPWLSPAGTFSPPPAAQVVSMCKMCPEAAGEPADTPWASDTHLLTHTLWSITHTLPAYTQSRTQFDCVAVPTHLNTHTHLVYWVIINLQCRFYRQVCEEIAKLSGLISALVKKSKQEAELS